MKCSYCEHELDVTMVSEQACGACIGGCRKIHCPYCGKENPMVPAYLDKILKKSKNKES